MMDRYFFTSIIRFSWKRLKGIKSYQKSYGFILVLVVGLLWSTDAYSSPDRMRHSTDQSIRTDIYGMKSSGGGSNQLFPSSNRDSRQNSFESGNNTPSGGGNNSSIPMPPPEELKYSPYYYYYSEPRIDKSVGRESGFTPLEKP